MSAMRRTVVRRKLMSYKDPTQIGSIRQHLADRHGVLFSVASAIDDETARITHNKIDHQHLGHRHRECGDMD